MRLHIAKLFLYFILIRSHANKVMAIIDQTVNALKNNRIEQMKEKLVKLGERHYIYGVKKEYLAVSIF